MKWLTKIINWIVTLGLVLIMGHAIKEELKKQYPNVLKKAPRYIRIMDKLC